MLTLLPALVYAGSVLFAPVSQFERLDNERETAISAALGNKKPEEANPEILPDGNRYIVQFKKDAELSLIFDSLEGIPCRLLAESEQRLFAVSADSKDFFTVNSEIIDYYEPDLERESLAVTDDPVTLPVYESAGIITAWDTVKASSDIIVAVLDTGVDRRHEDLAGINLLPGYDAVTKTAGVDSDPVGHGTGVIGIIAAQADNGLGIAGVAHGVTVLPIKVSASSTTIYSSDLIAGIRFAADAGAKIINMSVGGYTYSYAEEDAVNYAVEKGCVLISASGNGGNRPYADQKSYPASYDNVISVASCNENGERSDFSQYNDSVDVAVNGEMLSLPYVDEFGNSVYRTDSGTSFSCAIVSGIAALAATRAGNARFGADEFLSLIVSACGASRTDELGHGVINAYEITRRAHLPIITGVMNNGRYSDSVRIGFNRGTAVLNGEPFEDGEKVLANGRHSLTVTDGENEIAITFILDYDPISYKFEEIAAYSYFEFKRGSALLDGFPYNSGDHISTTGKHEFTLFDGDERLEKTIYLQYALPAVYGIENGGIYNKPVEIRIVGDGSAFLDGKEIYGEAAVCESGPHTLTVKSGNGAVTEEYGFVLDFGYSSTHITDYANGKAAIDSENGYFCLYGDSLVGVRIYDISLPEQYLHFLPTGRIYGHAFTEEALILFGDNGISLLDRATARRGEAALNRLGAIGDMSFYMYAENEIYGFGNGLMRKISLDGSFEEVREFGFETELAFYDDGKFCLLAPSSDRLVRIYDATENTLTSFELDKTADGVPLCFGEGLLAVGNELIDITNGNTVLEFCSNAAVLIENGLLYTDNRIIDIATGRELASFPYPVSDIVTAENGVYLFGAESVMTFIASGAEGFAAYGAAERLEAAISKPETINPYRTDAFYPIDSKIISAKANLNTVFFLLSDSNRIYSFDSDSFTEHPAVPLRFFPERLFVSNGYVTVTFKNSNTVYFAPVENAAEGRYVSFPAVSEYAAVANGRLYAVSGGRLAYCSTEGGETVVTSIRATVIDSDGERIFALNNGVFTIYDAQLRVIASTETEAAHFTLGSGVALGNSIYDKLITAEFARVDDEVLALRDGAIVTEKGVYSLALGRYVGSLGVNNISAVAITESNAVVSFGDALISVCRFDNGLPVTQQPSVLGVSNGSIYIDSTVIEYDIGMGFLDGKPFESGSAASGAGVHTFLVSLPCGQSVSFDFTIEANIEAIEFLVPDRTMSVGETVALRIKYLPDGASSVPVTFKCDSEGLVIGETGEITAKAVGEYTVTAEAVTDYGVFVASCKITVRDDLIVFGDESGIIIDRNNALAIGVPPATSADSLISLLTKPANAYVTDADGNRTNGLVGTGSKIILSDGKEITDTLTVVVTGDCDGDAYLTAYDLYLLERILRGHSYEAAYSAAADVNGNGLVADNDHRALRNMLLRPDERINVKPEENLFGISSVQTLTYIESGSVIDVAVCISGCKYARGVCGIIETGEGLEFIEAEATGWEIDAKDLGGGKISFYAHGDDGENCEKAFKVLLNLKFRVTAEAGSTISFNSSGFTVSFASGPKTVHFEGPDVFVYEESFGDLNIEFRNASRFEFDPEKQDYTAVIPYNSALADISVTRPQGYTVAVSGTVVPDSGSTSISISVTDENGSTSLYTIRVRRDDEPNFDTNCRLSALEIEGYRLSPQFDPDILTYNVSVPYGTEEISLYCVAQSASARVIISDTVLTGEITPITVTVGSPDGETLVYTVYVTVLPPVEESYEQSVPDENNGGFPTLTVAAIIGAIIVAAVIITVYIKLAKRDEELRKEQ